MVATKLVSQIKKAKPFLGSWVDGEGRRDKGKDEKPLCQLKLTSPLKKGSKEEPRIRSDEW